MFQMILLLFPFFIGYETDEHPLIIITTRNTKFETKVHEIEMTGLKPKTSVEFFQKYLERKNQNSEKSLEALCDTLGYFPLAMQQCLSYMNSTGTSAQEMSNMLLAGDSTVSFVLKQ